VSSNRLIRSFITNDLNDTQYDYHIAYRILWKALLIIFNLTILSLGLVACSEQPTPYRPPTIAFQATRPVLVTETTTATPQHVETSVPISTPACINNLTYLEDLTLPDGTVVKPGESLDKRWLVENSGTCNWDNNYRLKFMSGADLSAPLDQALYPARSGSKTTLQILFTAPSESGTYQSAWQAYDPQGEPFGDPVFIQLIVDTLKP
jgi:hypothetical protein